MLVAREWGPQALGRHLTQCVCVDSLSGTVKSLAPDSYSDPGPGLGIFVPTSLHRAPQTQKPPEKWNSGCHQDWAGSLYHLGTLWVNTWSIAHL